MPNRRYAFSWDRLGDIARGRPNLGPTTQVEIYRLMQFAVRDVLEEEFGDQMADQIFRRAGRVAGHAFSSQYLGKITDPREYLRRLQTAFRELGIGILRVEQANRETGRIVLTIEEDLDCSGVPEMDIETCKYDEGFIAGLLEAFTGRTYDVAEVDCWSTGERTCRFVAEVVSSA